MSRAKKTKPRLVVFTDLDGTLLDHDSYDFSPALPALAALHTANVPLILCSSKTRAELEYWKEQLNINHPLICENGGVLAIPEGYFKQPFDFQEEQNGYQLIVLGERYPALRQALVKIAKRAYLPLIGFGDMTIAQVAHRAGLPIEQAARAKIRDADEPFFIDREFGDEEVKRLEEAAAKAQLRITRGGRFFHLIGESDKGIAARRLIELYRAEWGGPIQTAGIGDSPNDLPLLQAVDTPIIMRKKSGEIDPAVQAQVNAKHSTKAGPAGWDEAILEILESIING
jgi:mannosyl-3-phosphoglycerate phosphatase